MIYEYLNADAFRDDDKKTVYFISISNFIDIPIYDSIPVILSFSYLQIAFFLIVRLKSI